MQFEITKAATFDAAHHFPNEPEGSIYRRLHGHSFMVEATVRSETLDADHGWVADLGALDRALKAAAEELDHGLLNDKPGLELPSLEKLCLWFVGRLQPEWPGLCRVTVGRPTINERCTLTL
ncbi:MAG: 6-pyruvoyl tetrahydropterin synthase family protein [Brevundimonas sp.]|uniref:6-pyruvoyl trahydropterin synthase family protein n=1 Tax=Brevundimonas sp. TaxID=1871086 RepID=UPI0025B8E02D|nr:6-carboxytetrahydropterin synthase [Brevundimonas sp.]MBX3477867.1 6-pyruvoyl tetrahydropterin synthase family protein [Brevundimonas sp.]